MSAPIEQRHSQIRRSINSIGMRDGEPEESKILALVGKGFCIWFLYKYSEMLISHENVLFVLLLFLIFPDLIKKLINVWADQRSGLRGNYTERVESHDSVTTTAADKAKEFT